MSEHTQTQTAPSSLTASGAPHIGRTPSHRHSTDWVGLIFGVVFASTVASWATGEITRHHIPQGWFGVLLLVLVALFIAARIARGPVSEPGNLGAAARRDSAADATTDHGSYDVGH